MHARPQEEHKKGSRKTPMSSDRIAEAAAIEFNGRQIGGVTNAEIAACIMRYVRRKITPRDSLVSKARPLLPSNRRK